MKKKKGFFRAIFTNLGREKRAAFFKNSIRAKEQGRKFGSSFWTRTQLWLFQLASQVHFLIVCLLLFTFKIKILIMLLLTNIIIRLKSQHSPTTILLNAAYMEYTKTIANYERSGDVFWPLSRPGKWPSQIMKGQGMFFDLNLDLAHRLSRFGFGSICFWPDSY